MGCDWDNKRGHSWVEAQGKIIEATSLEIAIDDTFYKQFITYHYKFADESEYDWWKSQYIKDQCPAIENMDKN